MNRTEILIGGVGGQGVVPARGELGMAILGDRSAREDGRPADFEEAGGTLFCPGGHDQDLFLSRRRQELAGAVFIGRVLLSSVTAMPALWLWAFPPSLSLLRTRSGLPECPASVASGERL